ncbi:hypothetical protein NDA01_03595 [Trichocoleus desertorum AS-A10]|uniref:hypothetical protein n=1 Tax=Trichocoleus desertorum TaxID=1481672 RepID=UPI003296D4FF
MDIVGIGLIVAIGAVAFFVSFWLELLIAGIFLKNLNNRYLAVLLLNLTPALLAVAKSPGKTLTFVLVGLPILGLMYWQAKKASLKHPA